MRLPDPPKFYQQHAESIRNRELTRADAENHKRDRDIEVGKGRVILTSPNGTRYALVVDDAGTLSTVAL